MFTKARNHRNFFGSKAKNEQKSNRAKNISQVIKPKPWSGSSAALRLHGILLYRLGAVDKQWLKSIGPQTK